MTLLRPLLLSTLLATSLFADSAAHEQIAALVRDHRWNDAEPLLTKAVAAEPTDAELHYRLGEVLLNLNREAQAAEELEKATALAPKNAEYLCLLGDAYGTMTQKASLFSQMGLAKKCKAAYEGAVATDPNSLHAHQGLMQYCMQAPGFVGGGMDQAYAQAAEIKRIDAVQGRLAYGMLYLKEKKYPEAFALYDEVLQAQPDDYMALYQYGRLAAMSGERTDRGIEALRKCLTLSAPTGAPGHSPAHWRLGNLLERKGDKSGARLAYEAAVQEDPDFKPARDSLQKLK
jgi:tetratricopeptide (TPR) repeat protein